MAEQVVWQDPHRGEQVALDDLQPHGLLDLIVDEDGLSASARLDRDGAVRVRDALDKWLRGATDA